MIGTWAGPCEPGTVYVMAHHSIGDVGDGHLGNWGYAEGGMGAVAGGNIFHGELSLEQLFHMRPAPGFADYRTPVSGLYYGSSATHAGGGVCGIPGWQAARAAIADKKASRRAGQLRKFARRS